MVVKRAGQRLLDVCAELPFLHVMPKDAAIVALVVAPRHIGRIALVQLFRGIEMRGETERLAHIGQEEAVARLTLQSHRQLTAQEEALAIGMLQGKFSRSCEVNTLEDVASQLLLRLLQ